MTLVYVLAGIVAAIALLAVFVATRPADFRVGRSAAVAAPPEAVFDLVNDFHNWDAWSPWAKLDPNMTVTHSGPPAGVGAGYAWDGKGQVGRGRMTITDSRPGERVAIDLRFEKPFRAVSPTTFTFTPEAGGTRVRWVMTGRKNFLFKAVGLFMDMDMDKLVGTDFEKGLAAMRTVAEGQAVSLGR